MLLSVGLLLAIGTLMVYSTTFDWSFAVYDNPITVFLQHLRNMGVGMIALGVVTLIDYRIWRRLAVWIMLFAIGSLIAVVLFADVTFGARRALLNGSFQPGELAELAIIIYMAAWLGSKSTRIRSVTYGLLPFAVLVGIVGGLVILQPDLSTAVTIFLTAGIMFFLAGADIRQLVATGLIVVVIGVGLIYGGTLLPDYASDRVDSFVASITDITQTNYQTQQAIGAIIRGGWTGVGLGESYQKFGFLPAPHTDSIFAIIGEELGVLGAGLVVFLYVSFVIRGLNIARRVPDSFGGLLVAGVTIWVALKALTNIAVMLALIPTSGVPLPFISYGGSSLLVLMIGVGLILNVNRVTLNRQATPDRRISSASYDRGGRHRRARLSSTGRRRGDTEEPRFIED